MVLIADTGFWLALANRRDQLHPLAQQRFSQFQPEGFITTWCVITETCYLLQHRLGAEASTAFLRKVAAGYLPVFDLTSDQTARIVALMEQYADLPMDLADASLVILAEHLGHGRILSVDRRDFTIYRWNLTQPFQNLLA